MDIASGIVVYLLLWWLIFFMALPIGVRTPDAEDVQAGHASSAPMRPLLVRKALATTLIAAVLWVAVFAIVESDLYSFRDAIRDW